MKMGASLTYEVTNWLEQIYANGDVFVFCLKSRGKDDAVADHYVLINLVCSLVLYFCEELFLWMSINVPCACLCDGVQLEGFD